VRLCWKKWLWKNKKWKDTPTLFPHFFDNAFKFVLYNDLNIRLFAFCEIKHDEEENSMNNKMIQTVRRIAQVLSFLFCAGIFSQAFSGVGQIYQQIIIKHNFSLAEIQLFLPLAIVIVLDVLFGRFFCGWFCAFGAFNDFLFAVSKKLFPQKRFRVNQKLDSYLKYLKYVALAAIVVFGWTFNLIATDTFDPWIAFARLGNIFGNGFSMGLLVLGLIGVGAMLIERFFCRYLCPLGALLAILSKIKLTSIHKPGAQCNNNCKLCSVSCPMNINLASIDTVNSGECISCLKCISVCRRENVRINIFSKRFNTMTYVVAAIILFLIINFKGRPVLTDSFVRASQSSKARTVPATRQVAVTKKNYNDGVYEGEADGFQPGLKVAVTVKNDQIVAIKIIGDHESRGFKEEPMQKIPQAIIKSQSTKVDAVSGATFTSRGIMNAVENALNKAKIKTVI
jgi:NosR/NirI family nitrous oxide reductase transcriptional regulator